MPAIRRSLLKAALSSALLTSARVPFASAVLPCERYTRVTDFGAKGDGISDDRPAILAAINHATKCSTNRVVIPRGTYRLSHSDTRELLPLRAVKGLHILGEDAVLRCNTPSGTVSIFAIQDSSNVTIEGLSIFDEGADRTIDWKGAVAIYLSGHGDRGIRGIAVRDCQFQNVLSAVTANERGGMRCSGISLANLEIRASYYGLNFQNNGDHVTATDIKCVDVRRSYFPYGITHHKIDIVASDNATGYTDALIKCYGRETAAIDLKVRSRGKRGGNAIVALEHQDPNDRGLIQDITLHLDVADAGCGLRNVVLLRALDKAGKPVARTRSQWQSIRLHGNVSYCAATTRMVALDSKPEVIGTLGISSGLWSHANPASLEGLERTLVPE